MIVSYVVATGPKREIGLNNKLLWHIPEDLKNFKKITSGRAIVMGRKTFESIGKALPDRVNIVITRDENFTAPNIFVVHDPMAAMSLALDYEDEDDSEMMVIGGAEIYNLFLPWVHKVYLSEVAYDGPADAYFPELPDEWKETHSEQFEKFKFKILERI
jgi:dihydrofolate reductase